MEPLKIQDDLAGISTEMVCNRCGKKISENDNYVIFEYYHKGDKHSKRYYHYNCFKDKLKPFRDSQLKNIIRKVLPAIREVENE